MKLEIKYKKNKMSKISKLKKENQELQMHLETTQINCFI